MEITDEIRQAISVLKQAGIKAQFVDSSTPEMIRIWGGIEVPFPPKRPQTKVIENHFEIVYHHVDWFAAFPAYGTQWIYIKQSKLLHEVVSAICDYFQMLAARAETTHYRITHGIYWLQRAGLEVQIMSAKDIRAAFGEHEYIIHLEQYGWIIKAIRLGEIYDNTPVTALRDAVEMVIDQHQRIVHADQFTEL